MDIDFTEVIEFIRKANDAKAVSLPQFTRPATVQSPLFIQDKLNDEPVRDWLIKTIYNLYTGYILVALKMNQMVDGSRTVRDVLGTISTGSMISGQEFLDSTDIVHSFGIKPGIEANDRIMDTSKAGPIPGGRIIELSLSVGDDKKEIKVLVNINLSPRSIPTDIVEHLISANYDQSIADRWLKAKAGEIRFFKDFILHMDDLERRTKALKQDRDGVLADIFKHQNGSSIRQIFKLAFMKNKSYNLANGILILDEADFNTHAKKHNLNMKKASDRARFFGKTFSLFICLVNTRYSTVTIYTHGIGQGAEYTYNELKSNSQSDKVDVASMMEFMAKNQLPKF